MLRSLDDQHKAELTRPRPRSRLLPDPRECPTVSVAAAAAILGISRGAAYAAVRDGTIASIRIGRRLLVPTARLVALLGGDVAVAVEPLNEESARGDSLSTAADADATLEAADRLDGRPE